MFLNFFLLLRQNHLPVSPTEYLVLLEALQKDVIDYNTEDFYFLSRSVLVKNEQHLDIFDRIFGEYFKGIDSIDAREVFAELPDDWFERALKNELSDEERELLEKEGGLEKLMERFRKILDEQRERHDGGSKWVGTGGTSPFGFNGYNPEGFRVKGPPAGNKTGVKVWENREYKNLDENVELNTRNMKMALRRLRILTREGAQDEFDIDSTIQETSRNGGVLDIQMQATRQNRVKVLMLFDIGGSMDEHVEMCSQLFSAAKYQFKHLEFYYFHNCVYEHLWRDAERRHETRLATLDVLHKYNKDYKVILVGDASMASYELTSARGSVEHYNEEPGMVWLERLKAQFPDLVWLNPVLPPYWHYTHSLKLIRDWSENRMFPLTLGGLTQAMKCLRNRKIRFEE